MKCPNCDAELKMSERGGVEIDYCPSCRGIWLDKGELDKIIERSAEHYHGKGMQEHKPTEQYYNKGHDPYYHKDKYHYKKKKGFLGDFFDFD